MYSTNLHKQKRLSHIFGAGFWQIPELFPKVGITVQWEHFYQCRFSRLLDSISVFSSSLLVLVSSENSIDFNSFCYILSQTYPYEKSSLVIPELLLSELPSAFISMEGPSFLSENSIASCVSIFSLYKLFAGMISQIHYMTLKNCWL